jgi:hypothetical protein
MTVLLPKSGGRNMFLSCSVFESSLPVGSENSVRSENAEFQSFVRSWWLPQPVPPSRQRSSHFVTNSRFSKRTRRVTCASTAATGSCRLCCSDCGPAGGDVYRWFSPDTFLRWPRSSQQVSNINSYESWRDHRHHRPCGPAEGKPQPPQRSQLRVDRLSIIARLFLGCRSSRT